MRALFKGSEDSIASDSLKEDQAWFNSLGADFFRQFNASNVNTLLEELEAGIKKITPLTVYISFEMDTDEINKLGMWLRKEINPSIVFETKIDPSLIGGCALSWKGILRDYSLRAKIQAEQTEILASFKSSMK